MDNRDDDIDSLIAKVLSGEASPVEVDILTRWTRESTENGDYFRQMELLFKTSGKIPQNDFDADDAWQKVHGRIQGGKSRVVKMAPEVIQSNLYLKIAATILVTVGLGIVIYLVSSNNQSAVSEYTAAATNQIQLDTLPGGAAVVMNKNTQLSYQFDQDENTHVVKLEGEAYFTIDKKEAGFVVVVDDILIKDIGTKFNVRAYAGQDEIAVTVEEGEVMFYSKTDSGLYLKKGGQGIYNRKEKRFSLASPDQNATAYKSKSFVFTEAPLEAVVSTLNKVYDTPVYFDSLAADCKISVSFYNESIEEIAEVLAETLSLSVEQSADGIHLKGSCSDL